MFDEGRRGLLSIHADGAAGSGNRPFGLWLYYLQPKRESRPPPLGPLAYTASPVRASSLVCRHCNFLGETLA
jgi:N-acetylmuramoyl-L-alanine amidase